MYRDQKTDLVYGVAVLSFVLLFVSVLSISRAIFAAPVTGEDAQFVSKAARSGIAEGRLGELAQANAKSDAVKQFGLMMETDHSKAGDQLCEVALKENITLPTELSKMDEETYDRLSKLEGAEFDREFTSFMVKDHKAEVAEFQREAHSGQNDSIKNFAAQALPTIESHLQKIEQTQGQLSASANSGM